MYPFFSLALAPLVGVFPFFYTAPHLLVDFLFPHLFVVQVTDRWFLVFEGEMSSNNYYSV